MRLEPCPFCGNQPLSTEQMHSDESGERYGYYAIECTGHNDGIFVGVHDIDSMDKAAEAWNRRAASPSTAKESD